MIVPMTREISFGNKVYLPVVPGLARGFTMRGADADLEMARYMEI